MKRYFFCFIFIGFSMINSIFAVSPTEREVSLAVGHEYATSEVVGISSKGFFYFKNTGSYSTYLTGQSFCAWDGYPYSVESQYELRGGQNTSWIENQSRDSNFKVRLWDSSKKTTGNATVSLDPI